MLVPLAATISIRKQLRQQVWVLADLLPHLSTLPWAEQILMITGGRVAFGAIRMPQPPVNPHWATFQRRPGMIRAPRRLRAVTLMQGRLLVTQSRLFKTA